jgi:hypothetical protein
LDHCIIPSQVIAQATAGHSNCPNNSDFAN